MTLVRRRGGILIAVALAVSAPAGAQSAGEPPRASAAPIFSGRYKLVITFGRGCSAAMQLGPQAVIANVGQSPIAIGSEVTGQSASPSETANDGRFVLLRQGDQLHGPSGAINDSLGLRTLQGYRVWMQVMADGSATTSSGRARASGTAFGDVALSRPGDAAFDSIGFCTALDHQWSLEPY
jgi:hypothetical protein